MCVFVRNCLRKYSSIVWETLIKIIRRKLNFIVTFSIHAVILNNESSFCCSIFIDADTILPTTHHMDIFHSVAISLVNLKILSVKNIL